MSTPKLTTIPRSEPGRPKSIRRKAEQLIGTAGVEALRAADLHIVSGPLVRELALIVNEPINPPVTRQEIIENDSPLP